MAITQEQRDTWVDDIHRAHRLYDKARSDGDLVRPDECEECGKPAWIYGHHEDYHFPFRVEWLCGKCHGKRHRGDLSGEFGKGRRGRPIKTEAFSEWGIKTLRRIQAAGYSMHHLGRQLGWPQARVNQTLKNKTPNPEWKKAIEDFLRRAA